MKLASFRRFHELGELAIWNPVTLIIRSWIPDINKT